MDVAVRLSVGAIVRTITERSTAFSYLQRLERSLPVDRMSVHRNQTMFSTHKAQVPTIGEGPSLQDCLILTTDSLKVAVSVTV